MKVSELPEYKDKTEKTGVRVWDYVNRIVAGADYIIIPVAGNYYAAVGRISGIRWSGTIKIESAMNRNFTKSELEQILGDLDDWEVVE